VESAFKSLNKESNLNFSVAIKWINHLKNKIKIQATFSMQTVYLNGSRRSKSALFAELLLKMI
tara:strand:- start:663 stop:851 length:189 start_codon:yes stop_codon:yes gene_type:complete